MEKTIADNKFFQIAAAIAVLLAFNTYVVAQIITTNVHDSTTSGVETTTSVKIDHDGTAVKLPETSGDSALSWGSRLIVGPDTQLTLTVTNGTVFDNAAGGNVNYLKSVNVDLFGTSYGGDHKGGTSVTHNDGVDGCAYCKTQTITFDIEDLGGTLADGTYFLRVDYRVIYIDPDGVQSPGIPDPERYIALELLNDSAELQQAQLDTCAAALAACQGDLAEVITTNTHNSTTSGVETVTSAKVTGDGTAVELPETSGDSNLSWGSRLRVGPDTQLTVSVTNGTVFDNAAGGNVNYLKFVNVDLFGTSYGGDHKGSTSVTHNDGVDGCAYCKTQAITFDIEDLAGGSLVDGTYFLRVEYRAIYIDPDGVQSPGIPDPERYIAIELDNAVMPSTLAECECALAVCEASGTSSCVECQLIADQVFEASCDVLTACKMPTALGEYTAGVTALASLALANITACPDSFDGEVDCLAFVLSQVDAIINQ